MIVRAIGFFTGSAILAYGTLAWLAWYNRELLGRLLFAADMLANGIGRMLPDYLDVLFGLFVSGWTFLILGSVFIARAMVSVPTAWRYRDSGIIARAAGYYLLAWFVGYILLACSVYLNSGMVKSMLDFFKETPADLKKNLNLSGEIYLALRVFWSSHGIVALLFVMFGRVIISVANWIVGAREDD